MNHPIETLLRNAPRDQWSRECFLAERKFLTNPYEVAFRAYIEHEQTQLWRWSEFTQQETAK
jgi:hypothetical protein